MISVLSLGAGVQSTTVALLAAEGEVKPTPIAAIFADTGEEPAAVYKHLAWLMEPGRLPFPVHIVKAWGRSGRIRGPLGDEILSATRGERWAGLHVRPPFFTVGPDGSKGMIRRQCTGEYKIDPIEREIRAILGLRHRQHWPTEPTVEQWIGISTDEASRMKPSLRQAIRVRWPLIELGMSRRDCLAWLNKRDYPRPPKSACTFCPFHSDAEWRRIRDEDPDGWSRAIEIDDAIRDGLKAGPGLGSTLYLHASRVPLREVDLSTAEERGQINLFENECHGVCGV